MYIILDINPHIVKRFNLVFSKILFAVSLLVGILVAGANDRSTFTSYYFLLVQIPILVIYLLVSRYRGTKLFFVYLSTFIFSTPVIWLPFIIGAFVNYSTDIMTIASLITYIIMLVMVKKQIAPLFHYALENLHKNWPLLCALPISYTILSFLTDGYNYTLASWQLYSYFRVFFLATIYSAYMIIFVFFKQISEQLIMKNEQAILAMQMDVMRNHLSQLKNSQTMASIYRHDIRHHLQYVNTCIAQSDYEESTNYIKSICSEIEQSTVVLYCENDSVNMILSSYVAKANSMETTIIVDAIIPAAIHIASTDLCVVLANGIENAILACNKISDRGKKKIHLSCHIKNDRLLIHIVNPYDGVITFQEDIPVSDKVGHGIGTKSIVNIIKKYNGLSSFAAKDNQFTMSVII